MPRNVRWFLILSYGSLAVGAVLAAVHFVQTDALMPTGGMGFVVWTQAFAFGLPLVLITLAGIARQAWARWVMLVLFVIGLYVLAPTFNLVRVGAISVADALVSIGQTVVQGIALGLIFSRSASAWYRRETPPETNF